MDFSVWKTANSVFSAHRNEPGLRFYPFDPTPNLGKIVQRKAAFVGDVRVGEECDVGDGVLADEKIMLAQMCFHDFERGPTAVAPSRSDISVIFRANRVCAAARNAMWR